MIHNSLSGWKWKNPIRIICDTHLRSPLASKIVSTATEIPTIIATAESDPEKQAPFLKRVVKLS